MCSGNASGLYWCSVQGWSGQGLKREGAKALFKEFGHGKPLSWANSLCGWFCSFLGHTLWIWGLCTSLSQSSFWLNWGGHPHLLALTTVHYKTLCGFRTMLVSKKCNVLLASYWTGGLLILLASLPHQVYQDVPAVLLSSPTPCGIIPPHSTVHIPLTLETQVPGEYRSTVYISTFGSQDPPMVSACFQNCSSKRRTSCGDILTFACKVLTIFAYPLVVGLLESFIFSLQW